MPYVMSLFYKICLNERNLSIKTCIILGFTFKKFYIQTYKFGIFLAAYIHFFLNLWNFQLNIKKMFQQNVRKVGLTKIHNFFKA